MIKKIFLLFQFGFLFLKANYIPSAEVPPTIPREFRAAWVAHVFNIDWPSSQKLSSEEQKQELIHLLDEAKRLKLNAIIFQVRSSADALYKSPYEPWTSWLSGKMGKTPDYDPLKFCIKQAHLRGIEVHAWFNPFRALASLKIKPSPDHISQTSPSLILPFRKVLWMDVSQEEAKQRVIQVVIDVLRRYDVDGIHLDDYFYPYPRVNKEGKVLDSFPDEESYQKYKQSGGKLSRSAWRRFHVNSMVETLYLWVKKIKPSARFGISPFGVWRPRVPEGVKARLDAYQHISADSKLWLEKGWCDYMSPQLYWSKSSPDQNFTTLFRWWSSLNKERPIWPGIASSRILSQEDPTRSAEEILQQIQSIRNLSPSWKGAIHWSMSPLLENRDGIADKLKTSVYTSCALVPPMTWLPSRPPQAPKKMKIKKQGDELILYLPIVKRLRKWVLQVRYQDKKWETLDIFTEKQKFIKLSKSPEFIALTPVNAYGIQGDPIVLESTKTSSAK